MLNQLIVFDLDDTLYKEIDYLRSAYQEISKTIEKKYGVNQVYLQMLKWYSKGENVFHQLVEYYELPLTVQDLLSLYRNHFPQIRLDSETEDFLIACKRNEIPLGLITDGRSITQRHKIKALGLERYITDIIISEEFGTEKPNEKNYLFFEKKYSQTIKWYIGDNLKKDFITPNRLGWRTVCLLDNGHNIHQQNFNVDLAYLPQYQISSFQQLKQIISL